MEPVGNGQGGLLGDEEFPMAQAVNWLVVIETWWACGRQWLGQCQREGLVSGLLGEVGDQYQGESQSSLLLLSSVG